MEKKIIAVALALLLMVTAFVGCSKKYETTEIGGKEYLLVTDADGDAIVDDDQYIAIVTDRDGEILTYENGENQTYYVDIPKEFVQGDGYIFKVEGDWKYYPNINGFQKIGNEKNIYTNVSEFENPYSTLDAYIAETEKSNKEVIEALKKEYPNAEITISDGKVTTQNLPCKIVETKIEDEKGMFYYGYVVHFAHKNKIISINYTSQNYSYEETDVLTLFNNSFTFGDFAAK